MMQISSPAHSTHLMRRPAIFQSSRAIGFEKGGLDMTTIGTPGNDILSGELLNDALHKALYATDASVYRKIPLAVAYPKDESDIQKLIKFANQNSITLIKKKVHIECSNHLAQGSLSWPNSRKKNLDIWCLIKETC